MIAHSLWINALPLSVISYNSDAVAKSRFVRSHPQPAEQSNCDRTTDVLPKARLPTAFKNSRCNPASYNSNHLKREGLRVFPETIAASDCPGVRLVQASVGRGISGGLAACRRLWRARRSSSRCRSRQRESYRLRQSL